MSASPKIIYYPSPGKVYSPEELRELFSKLSVNDPLIVALRQLFQARFAMAAIDAAEPTLTERQAGHAGGRIQEITDFRDEFLSYLAHTETDQGELKPKGGRK